MPRYAYQRLSAQDTLFLVAESPNTPMHIAAVQIVEVGDLRTPEGGIDIERYKDAISRCCTGSRATARRCAGSMPATRSTSRST